MNRPDWLKVRYRNTQEVKAVKEMLEKLSLNTVCEEASCPNIMECFGRKTATFMILGRVCTRNCTFCNVARGETQPVDKNEPENVAKAVSELGLRHVVITSVTRDDMPDGGAAHYANVINAIKEHCEDVIIEVLIPDFIGDVKALGEVINSRPHIINHNVETVPRLYSNVRPMADYKRSLELLYNIKKMNGEITSKSGIMLGLGEKEEEVMDVLKDLRDVSCEILTIGQYLAPSKKHHPVVEYVHPEVFERLKDGALKMGFSYVASAPLVRSSYMADRAYGI